MFVLSLVSQRLMLGTHARYFYGIGECYRKYVPFVVRSGIVLNWNRHKGIHTRNNVNETGSVVYEGRNESL